MSAGGEAELICDFAEYYHVLNWRGLPLSLAATLAAGLPRDSRSKRRLRGDVFSMDTLLLARIVDGVNLILWRYSKEGTDKPESILEALLGSSETKPKPRVFRSGAEFMRAYEQVVR